MKLKWFGLYIFIFVMIQFLYHALSIQTSTSVLLIPIFILLIFGLFDYITIEKQMNTKTITQKDLYGIIYVMSGFVFTIILGMQFNMHLIMASALTGFIGYVATKPYEKEVYLGSFAGMITLSIANPVMIGLMVILLPMTYILSKDLFIGYGGKLGTVAFVTGFFAIALSKDFEMVSPHLLLEVAFFPFLLIAFLTIVPFALLKIKFKLNGVMLSSALCLIMSLMIRSDTGIQLYLPFIFALSFVIMSDDDKMKQITFLIVTPLVITILYLNTMHMFVGFGGKAGLIALISVLIAESMHRTFIKTFHKSEGIKHAPTT